MQRKKQKKRVRAWRIFLLKFIPTCLITWLTFAETSRYAYEWRGYNSAGGEYIATFIAFVVSVLVFDALANKMLGKAKAERRTSGFTKNKRTASPIK